MLRHQLRVRRARAPLQRDRRYPLDAEMPRRQCRQHAARCARTCACSRVPRKGTTAGVVMHGATVILFSSAGSSALKSFSSTILYCMTVKILYSMTGISEWQGYLSLSAFKKLKPARECVCARVSLWLHLLPCCALLPLAPSDNPLSIFSVRERGVSPPVGGADTAATPEAGEETQGQSQRLGERKFCSISPPPPVLYEPLRGPGLRKPLLSPC